MASLKHDQYTIAWICALPLEMAAACAMLTKAHTPLSKASTDPNAYELGELNGHFIVIACLPAGVYGKVSAATIVSRMRSTFPRLQFGLMVGIGGGVPSNSNDIRLGDVVVSKPVGKYTGVIQYDYGKAVQGGQFEPTGALNKPPQALLTHISRLEAKQMTGGEDDVSKIVSDVLERNPNMKKKFSPPEQATDFLFHSSYYHGNKGDNCENCDKEQLVNRQRRDTRAPFIYYGLIASGDQVMKDSETRDRLAQRHGILCFEMEAAGLMDDLPTLVIRGICDYCDSHKQKDWQGYAALTAAAYAKLLLSVVPVRSMDVDSPKSNKARHWVVSLARNPRFVGRQDEITKLEELITMQDGPRRVAITGLGGIGKTQVALEVTYRIRDRDKECSVFWVPCTSHGMIEQTFANIAQTLGLHDVKPAEAKEQIKIYLSSERAGKWLLIFDNADDPEMWLTGNDTAPALEDFLPQSDQGHILFTSRNGELAVDLTGSNIISIPDVDKETASNILENILLQKHLLEDHITTVALLEQLAFLPLAIAQASAYINKKRLTLSAYLTLLQEEEDDAVELLSEDFRDPGRYKDIQNPVITTWLISFKQIQHQDPLAADYLSFMACINPRNIPHSLLPPQTSRKQRLDALGLLNAYSFTNSQDLDISMHRLVHIATRNWLRKNGLFGHWIQRVADRMDIVFPNAHYTNRGLWREYLPRALALVYDDEFIVQQEQYSILVEKIADCLDSDGKYHEAEALYKTLIRINQDRDGIEHTTTLTSMAKLALIYWHQGRWSEAEQLNIQVLERRKTVLGAQHPYTLASINNLASIYYDQGRLKEAENLIVEVVETMKIVLGTEHPNTLSSMANLASIYGKQRRWSEAEKLIIQVIEGVRAVLGEEHPDTLVSIGNLATFYMQQERWHEAETLRIQVMERSKAVLGAEHPHTLACMGNLATTYGQQGRWHEAETLGIKVMERSKAVLGADHPDTLNIMANLAYICESQGKYEDALSLLEKCLESRNKVLGPSHPDTRSTCYAVRHLKDKYSLSPSYTPQEHPLE
ncbi:Tetratricopeptide repeat [Aspergillus parasiticus SU-1]|uniref:Tetratricopeptide repeat n=1 Tax=Aspergillus parasiticus (strain ATCC 56775 / NRRL 5862 / SRRC 143 / SU-1) TaxID=1403190 RepID=A0A0F0ID38_ASPPU|nr:Tetratricopeptide repeat [Aspergillus parasiticus SU-1]